MTARSWRGADRPAYGQPREAEGDAAQVGPLDRVLLSGVAVFRAAAWAWAALVVVSDSDSVRRPGLAAGLLVVMGLASLAALVQARVAPRRLAHPTVLAAEVALASVVVAVDPTVNFSDAVQTFGSAWPIASLFAAAVVGGPWWGLWAGVALAAGRAVGAGIDPSPAGLVAAGSAGALFVLAGVASGWVVRRLRAAEGEIAEARARAEVARELHDGVLQTLAVIQRRSTDDDLVQLARTQERDLRALLATVAGRGDTGDGPADLVARLREVAARHDDRWGHRTRVTATSPVAATPGVVEALAAAAAEALNNVAKHAGGCSATVFIDADDDGILVDVVDTGDGFEPGGTPRRGLERSVEDPVASVGGSVEIASRPGAGTEVRLRVPLPHDSRTDLERPGRGPA